jgi:FkbM family methyltransferase
MFRTMVERFSRNRILKRRLPPAFGSRAIYVSPDSALRFWGHDISRVASELFVLAGKLVRPGDIVWDAGANVGLFSFAAAAKAGATGKVLAIEPDPWLGTLLRRSAAEVVSDAAPVDVLNVAVSDRSGILEFNIAKRGRSSNFVSGFGSTQAGGPRSSFPVVAVTLDWLSEHSGSPAIIKIDVESMEHLVLRGASAVLRSRPVIITEVGQEHMPEVSELLKGYRLLDTELRPIVGGCPFNIIAVPA